MQQMDWLQDKNQNEMVFQVSEFNEFINNLISVKECVVEGEISEINVRQNRWVFMTLKDPEKEEVLNVFATFYQVREFINYLQVGSLVHVYGYPRLYGKSGKFSLSAYKIVPVGDGKLMKAFLELKAKLEAEGLFDEGRKRSLPPYPARVFLLTAPGSRAYSDFVKVTRERGFGKITIYHIPIRVQGVEAVPSILRAFRLVRMYADQADLVVITRGGGSLEDLQAFNDESVVRSAFGLPIPLVSAIGHEADVSLVDFVADVRASTPSNAAEIIFPSLSEVSQELDLLNKSLIYYMNQKWQKKWHDFIQLKTSLVASFKTPFDRVRDLEIKLKSLMEHYGEKIKWLQVQNKLKSEQMNRAVGQVLSVWVQRWEKNKSLLMSFDPKAVLKRGYSITVDAKGGLIKGYDQVKKDQELITYLSKGKIKTQVKGVYER